MRTTSYKQSPLSPSTWTAQISHYQGAYLALLEIFKSAPSGGVLGLQLSIPLSQEELFKDFRRTQKQMWAIIGMQSQLKIKRWQIDRADPEEGKRWLDCLHFIWMVLKLLPIEGEGEKAWQLRGIKDNKEIVWPWGMSGLKSPSGRQGCIFQNLPFLILVPSPNLAERRITVW